MWSDTSDLMAEAIGTKELGYKRINKYAMVGAFKSVQQSVRYRVQKGKGKLLSGVRMLYMLRFSAFISSTRAHLKASSDDYSISSTRRHGAQY